MHPSAIPPLPVLALTASEDVSITVTDSAASPQCSDTLDNDSDGLIDYPADPGCTGPSDTDEFNPVTITLTLGDDNFQDVVFTNGFTFPFYGVTRTRLFVSSNGRLTFNTGDGAAGESASELNEQPQIALLFDDLCPQNGGLVTTMQFKDKIILNWQGTPEYSTTGANTMSATLFSTGRIELIYYSTPDTIKFLWNSSVPSMLAGGNEFSALDNFLATKRDSPGTPSAYLAHEVLDFNYIYNVARSDSLMDEVSTLPIDFTVEPQALTKAAPMLKLVDNENVLPLAGRSYVVNIDSNLVGRDIQISADGKTFLGNVVIKSQGGAYPDPKTIPPERYFSNSKPVIGLGDQAGKQLVINVVNLDFSKADAISLRVCATETGVPFSCQAEVTIKAYGAVLGLGGINEVAGYTEITLLPLMPIEKLAMPDLSGQAKDGGAPIVRSIAKAAYLSEQEELKFYGKSEADGDLLVNGWSTPGYGEAILNADIDLIFDHHQLLQSLLPGQTMLDIGIPFFIAQKDDASLPRSSPNGYVNVGGFGRCPYVNYGYGLIEIDGSVAAWSARSAAGQFTSYINRRDVVSGYIGSSTPPLYELPARLDLTSKEGSIVHLKTAIILSRMDFMNIENFVLFDDWLTGTAELPFTFDELWSCFKLTSGGNLDIWAYINGGEGTAEIRFKPSLIRSR
ncbi:MAG: hypothetical protein AAB539_00475 [Patescibacteria group bacterium]